MTAKRILNCLVQQVWTKRQTDNADLRQLVLQDLADPSTTWTKRPETMRELRKHPEKIFCESTTQPCVNSTSKNLHKANKVSGQ